MNRNRSSSKRAHSPAVVSEGPSKKLPQLDGACFSKSSSSPSETVQPARLVQTEKPAAPKMPDFLKISDEETQEKYAELVKLENARLAASKQEPEDGQWARLAPDPTLDRYNNIHPWANNRVKLQVPEGFNDYINASPVTLTSTSEVQSKLKSGIQDKYICMQGPKKETVDHVWHMVWHELAVPFNSSPAVVIMLSPTHAPVPHNPSQLFEKCYQYFPKDENAPPLIINETNQLGEDFKATIKFVSQESSIEGTSIEIRNFIMTVEGEDEEKPIIHYLYPDWPDFGALEEENVASILSLMDISRKANGRGENARLVHCSAGVGRTGTFVALEFLIGELQGGAWEGWDNSSDPIFETVNQLRMQRKTMVQAYEQYAFLYEVLRKIWEEKYNEPCVGGDHKHIEKTPPPATNVCGNTSE